MSVDILLATYNGEAFLSRQLDSIAGQTYGAWHLLVRDDGSTDNTIRIIKEFQSKHSNRVTLLEDELGSLGATGNFSALMEASTASYIAFCDQDDIWLPEKVDVMMKRMKLVEQSPSLPVFLFSDLSMIDDSGALLAESLWQAENLHPERVKLNQLLVQNVPYGCASMINRALLELAVPVADEALLHDHWTVLLASSCGFVDYISTPTIRHRIHDSNASRGNNPIRKAREQSVQAILKNRNFDRYFSQLQDQAAAVKERLLQQNYSGEALDVLTDFINLRDRGLIARKYLMIKRQYFKHSKLQSLKWLLRI